MLNKYALLLKIIILLLVIPLTSHAWTRGIYITQPTLENTRKIKELIRESKHVDIDTFIIDVKRQSKKYQKNISLVKRGGLKYVARVVIFPYGGHHHQVNPESHWQKKYRLVKYALELGADQVQLDFIRYSEKTKNTPNKSHNIKRIIKWYEKKVNQHGVPLQVAVYAEEKFGSSSAIVKNLKIFANSIDVLNPLFYPSHYEPYRSYARQPYNTVLTSLLSLRQQFNGRMPFAIYPYIEISNYRHPISRQQKYNYIYQQIRAVKDGKANGWYAWSARNHYKNLFHVLKTKNSK